MINFVTDFHFTDPWINSMDHDVLTSEILQQSTNNNFVETEINNKYADYNTDNSKGQHGVMSRPEGHGVWFPIKDMYHNSSFLNICDVLDENDKTIDDKLYVYKIDMYGAINWALPSEYDFGQEHKNLNTIIDRLSVRALNALQKNDNFHLMINYNWEGIIYDHNFIVLHSKLHQYKIPHNKVLFSFAGYNINKWYRDFCEKHKIKNRIKVFHLHWVWDNKSEEFYGLSMDQDWDKINKEYIVEPKKHDFNNLNRRLRRHRLWTIAKLKELDLIKNNIVTYDFTIPENRNHLKWIPEIEFNNDHDFTNLRKQIHWLQLYEDKKTYDFDDLEKLWGINHERSSPYADSMLTLVSETTVDEGYYYISEKTIKPIGHKHPFIVMGTHGTLAELKKEGFKTFHPFINEDYDLIENMNDRCIAVLNELKRIVYLSNEEKIEWMKNVKPIVDYNFRHLLNFKIKYKKRVQQRTQELFKKFDYNEKII